MPAQAFKVARWSAVALIAALCIAVLAMPDSTVRRGAKARPGSLGSLIVCRLPSGEEVLWGPNQGERKPEGSREKGNIDVMLDYPTPAGPFSRWTQPYELWVRRSMRDSSSDDRSRSLSDVMVIWNHAAWYQDERLARIASEMPTQPPAPDPQYVGGISRRYAGTLVVWQAIWMSALRVASMGVLCLCGFVLFRWVHRTLNRKPGHCVACGYDMRGLPRGSPCPECGPSR